MYFHRTKEQSSFESFVQSWSNDPFSLRKSTLLVYNYFEIIDRNNFVKIIAQLLRLVLILLLIINYNEKEYAEFNPAL